MVSAFVLVESAIAWRCAGDSVVHLPLEQAGLSEIVEDLGQRDSRGPVPASAGKEGTVHFHRAHVLGPCLLVLTQTPADIGDSVNGVGRPLGQHRVLAALVRQAVVVGQQFLQQGGGFRGNARLRDRAHGCPVGAAQRQAGADDPAWSQPREHAVQRFAPARTPASDRWRWRCWSASDSRVRTYAAVDTTATASTIAAVAAASEATARLRLHHRQTRVRRGNPAGQDWPIVKKAAQVVGKFRGGCVAMAHLAGDGLEHDGFEVARNPR